jgi:tetratricopeptide (TPR) repeat protein
MRFSIALALYVYLAALSSLARAQDQPETGGWKAVRNQAVAALDRQDYRASEEFSHKAWDLATTPIESGISAFELGIALHHQEGREREAKSWMERALEIWRKHPEEHFRIGRTADTLATVYRNLGDYSGAERLLREAMNEPTNDVETKALVMQSLADLLREEGYNSDSLRLFRQASKLPGISWRRQIDSTIGIADLESDLGDWDASVGAWTRAADTAREHRDSFLEAVAVRGLGQTYLEHGDLVRAEPLLKRSLAMLESDSSASKHQVGAALASLGNLYLNENKLAMAEETLLRAIDLMQSIFGADHPQTAVLYEMLAETSARQKKPERARMYMERAHRIITARFGEKSPAAAAVLANWGVMEQRLHDPNRAAREFEAALAILRAVEPNSERLRLSALERYAEVLKETHRKDEARAVMAEMSSFRARH